MPTLVLEPGGDSADTIGMFLRAKTRKKDGKEHRYAQSGGGGGPAVAHAPGAAVAG